MKTSISTKSCLKSLPRSLLAALTLFLGAFQLSGQGTEDVKVDSEPSAKSERPEATDAASTKLIRNYLTASGRKESHDRILNVRARGVIDEAGRTRNFELIETRDGRRRLTFTWRLLGRDHEEVHIFDGLKAWTQTLKPKEELTTDLSGAEARHFSNQRWLLHPFVLPMRAKYEFEFQSKAKVGGRPAFVIVGYGPKNVRSWFYLDQETFLVIRSGGLGQVARTEEYLDYRATEFEYVDGIVLPKSLDLMVEEGIFGSVRFDSIETNIVIDSTVFQKPEDNIPVLRSGTKTSN